MAAQGCTFWSFSRATHLGSVSDALVLHVPVFSDVVPLTGSQAEPGWAGWAVLRSLPSAAHLSRTPPLPLPLYPCGKLGQSLWGKQMFQFKIWISVLSPGRELGVAFPPSPVSTCSVLSSRRIFVLLDNGAAAHLL